ncbi:MAG: holo-ACP synthase [Acidimicrobiales bacterium]
MSEASPTVPCAVCGIGIDVVEIERFAKVLARRPSLAMRVFTDAERAEVTQRAYPPQHLAARFAAKEALMKALAAGIGAFSLKEVEVVRAPGVAGPSGPPMLALHGKAAEVADRLGVTHFHVSLTHSGPLALAVVLAERTGAA